MISLIFSILSTVTLFIIFKEFNKRGINTFHAITFNYLSAFMIGLLYKKNNYTINYILNAEWIYPTILLGVIFVIMFNIMAKTTQIHGISIASMASKISLIIPVLISYLFYEKIYFSLNKLFGVVIAMIAVYLTFKKSETNKKSIKIAIILFFGAGILDTFLNYIQDNLLKSNSEFNIFIIVIFLIAFLSGLVKIVYLREKINIKSIIGGVILSIPNYFSIYFVLKSLDELGGFTVFSILNVSVVLFSSIISYFVYNEFLSKINWIGIILACISIILILI
tara:strand:- start:2438 stop:3277 length:840 start_codon:yes stop_codon:yes gene_type:complete